MTDSKRFEFPVTEYGPIKATYELIKKRYRRGHREIEKSAAALNKTLDELNSVSDVAKAMELLSKVANAISGCKRKAELSYAEELKLVLAAKRRIEHVNELSAIEKKSAALASGNVDAASGLDEKPTQSPRSFFHPTYDRTESPLLLTRLHRHLADYLFVCGYPHAALKLARERPDLCELCPTELFEEAVLIEDALYRGDTAPAHAWLQEANFKLKKNENHLEFDLRVFEFYLLVREGKRMEAILHARKYMSSVNQPDEYRATKLGQAMILLAMRTPEELQSKAESSNLTEKWIVKRTHEVLLEFYSYPTHSAFHLILNAGMSAIKTHQCYEPKSQHRDCAVCHPVVNQLATHLPFGRHDHSVLTCYQTGLVMDEHNPPMSLPNGYVYSQQGIADLTGVDGMITCPRSGEKFESSQVQRVYIL